MARKNRSPKAPSPSALICALFEDGGRFLFLKYTDSQNRQHLDLPNTYLFADEDPISRLKTYLNSQLSIDSQIHGVRFSSRYNSGSKKHKHWIPVLAFECTAKRIQPIKKSDSDGFCWLSKSELSSTRFLLSKKSIWLSRCP